MRPNQRGKDLMSIESIHGLSVLNIIRICKIKKGHDAIALL